MRFVNLTPHTINLTTGPVAPDGRLARCAEVSLPAGTWAGIALVHRHYGEVTGLPEPEPDVLYIVSALVRLARPERHDIASPGDLVRDSEGKITGAANLVIN